MTTKRDYTIHHWRKVARVLWVSHGPDGLQFYDDTSDPEQRRCIALLARALRAAYEAGRKGSAP
jgi:hypothetical protein